MPPGFTASLARRLDQTSPFTVSEAADGDRLQPGRILVAPGGCHLQFDAGGLARLTSEPPVHGVRPAIDITLASLAPLYGPRLIAALLTGMGRDGARGLKLVSDLGGRTLAEDETTCVVYGMPKAAVELGGVGCLLPLPEIAPAIVRLRCAELKPKKRNPMISTDMAQFLDVFLDEGREQLALLESSILEMEQGGHTPEMLQGIFRAAHTLKGSSRAMGFLAIGDSDP